MASTLNLGTILLDGVCVKPGAEYQPGQIISFDNGNDIQWIIINRLLISAYPLLCNISWDDLDTQNFVFGKKLTFSGNQFLCRLLKVGERNRVPNDWDTVLDEIGETDDIQRWGTIHFWGQESVIASNRAIRGYNSANTWIGNGSSIRIWTWHESSYRRANLAFRPVLELLASDNLVLGNRVCAIGGQSILYGKLVTATIYDTIIQPESGSIMAAADEGKLYSYLSDGTIAIDRSKVTVQNSV